MRIEGRKLLSGADRQPMLQIFSFSVIQRMEQKHRECKIIYIIIPVRQLFLHEIMLMNFSQHLCAIRLDDLLAFLQQLPDIRFDKKAACSRFFGRISEGVQANQRRSVRAKPFQIVLNKFFSGGRFTVDIDLLLIKRAPNLFIAYSSASATTSVVSNIAIVGAV